MFLLDLFRPMDGKENRRQRNWLLSGISSIREGLFAKLGKRTPRLESNARLNTPPPGVANGHLERGKAVFSQPVTSPATPTTSHVADTLPRPPHLLKRDLRVRYGFPLDGYSTPPEDSPSPFSSPALKRIRLSPSEPAEVNGLRFARPGEESRLLITASSPEESELSVPNGYPCGEAGQSTPASRLHSGSRRRIRLSSERRFNPYKPPVDLFNNRLWNYTPGDLTKSVVVDNSSRPEDFLSPFTARNQQPLFAKSSKNYDIAALKRYKSYLKRMEEEGQTAVSASPRNTSIQAATPVDKKLHRLRDLIRNFPPGRPNDAESPRRPEPPQSPSSVADNTPTRRPTADYGVAGPSTSTPSFTPLIDLTQSSGERSQSDRHESRANFAIVRRGREPSADSVASAGSDESASSRADAISLLKGIRRKNSTDALESRWRSEKYRDEQQRNALLIRQFEDECTMRGKARLNRQIYSQEQLRAQLKLEGLLLERPVSKRDEFPPLSDVAFDVVARAWDPHASTDEVMVKGFDVDLTRKDLLTLAGTEWLNDEVINFFMNLLVQRSKQDKTLPSVYTFSTFFYANLVSKGYTSVKRWTRKVDIFTHEILIIPVHLSMHWCLCTVDLKCKSIIYYDSMGGDNKRCLDLVKDYLQKESLDKRKREFSLEGWTAISRKDIPRQMNGSDCGMFTCRFAEYAARRAPINFSQTQMPYYRQRTVFEICSMKLMS